MDTFRLRLLLNYKFHTLVSLRFNIQVSERMSCCHQPVLQEARPGTARVRVTDLTGSGLINPTPDMDHSESEAEVETFDLSPEKLVGSPEVFSA